MWKKPANFLIFLFGVIPPVRCYPLLRYALGLLEAGVCGRYEAPWDRDEPHPLIALQAMTEEVDNMARAVVERLMDEA